MHPVVKSYLKRPDFMLKTAVRWYASETSDLKTVFVMGPPRSGTTLLQRLILNHSKVFGFPLETNIVSPRPIFDYSRFADYVPEEIYKSALADSRSLIGFFDLLHRRSFPDRPEDSWIVEKTPQHARNLAYILNRMPEAKVVFVVRDGRDTLCSGRSAQNIPQANVLSSHAAYYNACVFPLMNLKEGANRVKLVRYEEFTASPERQLSDICRFLGLEPELETQLHPSQASDDKRAGEKAFERLGQAITPATVGRWRTEMTPEEIAEYKKIAGRSLAFLGYEV
ncbi:sulfotransferase [Celeribacter sp. PS-C1]|uniref:sulfotransferase family protein n=1 Tax=Celeribacter sp. PS-C1 TaxID=2820813 RepID=UPI001C67F4C5|nr:sulfotransferase [Celeribacter sp. PS-C1]MBW6417909.1 sulfotransferase [Celeribacter sp. PS-C1]